MIPTPNEPTADRPPDLEVALGERTQVMTVHHRYATIDGRSLFYREAGPSGGPVLVLLHGFPTSSFMYRYLIPLLADRYHVIAPDYLGFGFSDTPSVDEFDYGESIGCHDGTRAAVPAKDNEVKQPVEDLGGLRVGKPSFRPSAFTVGARGDSGARRPRLHRRHQELTVVGFEHEVTLKGGRIV
jgi:pimeloyl-ACP methyl ester carboxylesterase